MSDIGHNTELSPEQRRVLAKHLPPLDVLSEIFTYEPDTGMLRWRKRYGDNPGIAIFNGTHAGKPAGSHHQGGYMQVSFMCGGVKIKALVHRVCFFMHYGFEPPEVDHVNGDRKDNRAENLREATSSENHCNRSVVVSKSRLKGVYTHRCTGKFFSQIVKHKKTIYLGIFEKEVDAAIAYDAAAERLHGEFARTNRSLGLIGESA